MHRTFRRVTTTVIALACLLGAALPVAAADADPILRGTVVGPDGRPFAVVDGRATIIGPDGGAVANRFEVATDGSFAVPLMPWGTSAQPAAVTLRIEGLVGAPEPTGNGCFVQYAPVATITFDVALADGSDPAPVQVVAAEELVDEFCGGVGNPDLTLPPTGPGGAAEGIALAPLVGLLSQAASTVLQAGRAFPG